MDAHLKDKLLRLTIMTLEVSQGHLRTLQLEELAEGMEAILEKCNTELTNMVPDPEPGVLMDRED